MKICDQSKEPAGLTEFAPSEIVAQSDETTLSKFGVAAAEMENS